MTTKAATIMLGIEEAYSDNLVSHLRKGTTYAVVAMTARGAMEWIGLADATEVDDLIVYDNEHRPYADPDAVDLTSDSAWVDGYAVFNTGRENYAPVMSICTTW